ncbi:MAG: hypothetical protein ACOCSQ_06095 [Planctomycetota bacterium]
MNLPPNNAVLGEKKAFAERNRLLQDQLGEMKRIREEELARPNLSLKARGILESFAAHWDGLIRLPEPRQKNGNRQPEITERSTPRDPVKMPAGQVGKLQCEPVSAGSQMVRCKCRMPSSPCQ